MPKIIFRPNPTPPPFVPPTPGYATELHVTLNPVEFTPDSGYEMTIAQASLPEFDSVAFGFGEGDSSYGQIYRNDFAFDTPISMQTEYDYDSSSPFIASFLDGNGMSIYEIPVIIDNA